jgi:cytochrome oxidase Cu insertion factor (SCO1/SenC/PrrC family)
MDHSSAVLLTNPEGKLHAVFAAPHVPEKITEAFLKIRR